MSEHSLLAYWISTKISCTGSFQFCFISCGWLPVSALLLLSLFFSVYFLFSAQVFLLVQFIFCLPFQLTVFHMNKHEDLDLAILSVLLKGKFTHSLTMVQIGKHFQRTIVNIFIPISLNTSFGCSKEPSH